MILKNHRLSSADHAQKQLGAGYRGKAPRKSICAGACRGLFPFSIRADLN
jgi:hypothetical protein